MFDPNECYRDMLLDAIEGSYDRAIDLAEDLYTWIHSGGYKPRSYLASVHALVATITLQDDKAKVFTKRVLRNTLDMIDDAKGRLN